MDSRSDTPVLTSDEESLLGILEFHRGRRNAIKTSKLSRLTGINERKVRKLIHRLREVFHMPIGSSPSPGGFYIPETQAELKEVADRFLSFGLKQLHMYYILMKITKDQFSDQIILEIKNFTL